MIGFIMRSVHTDAQMAVVLVEGDEIHGRHVRLS